MGRDGEERRQRPDREQRDKFMCAQCEVIGRCGRHALEVGEAFGVRGGLSAVERAPRARCAT
ncbi:WhiB family transcriptional regulator [Mycolicibacterium chubuense]|uniref:WhiB family transcriptional regulator n=1 Tax=Mycolicibacterium chubuense TaxID=1800 RepID=UPI00138AD25F